MTAHAALGASSAYRWMACPGSLNLIAATPDAGNKTTPDAEKGTAAHEMAAMCLNGGLEAIECIDRVFNGHICDEDMATAVQVWLDFVRAETEDGDLLFIEQRFDLTASLNAPAPMFGTADACIYKPKLQKLIVPDYKHGQGVVVEVTNNKQGRYYALGACYSLSDRVIRDVEIAIVQPRAPHRDGPVRRETVPVMDLIEWSGDLLEAAHETQKPDAPLVAGDHCRFCPVNGTCPALRNKAMAAAQMEFTDLDAPPHGVPPLPTTLTTEQLAGILRASDVVNGWMKSVKAYAFELMQRGIDIPGWKIVGKRGRRKWINEADPTAVELMTRFDIDAEVIFEQKLRSPAQIEKRLPAARRKELAALVVSKSSGPTLAREEDTRPALSPSALLDFAPLEDDDDGND